MKTHDFHLRETREIAMPDGTRVPVTQFKLIWQNMDTLIATTSYTPDKLVEFALHSQKETGHSFEQSLRNVVAYVTQLVGKSIR